MPKVKPLLQKVTCSNGSRLAKVFEAPIPVEQNDKLI
jgi:hypothetical protein